MCILPSSWASYHFAFLWPTVFSNWALFLFPQAASTVILPAHQLIRSCPAFKPSSSVASERCFPSALLTFFLYSNSLRDSVLCKGLFRVWTKQRCVLFICITWKPALVVGRWDVHCEHLLNRGAEEGKVEVVFLLRKQRWHSLPPLSQAALGSVWWNPFQLS